VKTGGVLIVNRHFFLFFDRNIFESIDPFQPASSSRFTGKSCEEQSKE
jgi:hypothetical protein